MELFDIKKSETYTHAENQIEKHQLRIEILEGVQHFARLIELKKESINGFAGTFPRLRRKYLHNIEIYKMCIARLYERYEKV